jgi:hypothetical protein
MSRASRRVSKSGRRKIEKIVVSGYRLSRREQRRIATTLMRSGESETTP